MKIVYIDMDGVLCDYHGHYLKMKQEQPSVQYPQSREGFFLELTPLEGAIETVKDLLASAEYDPYILTAPSVMNPHCYSEKRQWVEQHLGMDMVKRLIISPHKHLNKGDYLIDDCLEGRGQDKFDGELLHFGSKTFPTWTTIRQYLKLPALPKPRSTYKSGLTHR